MNTRKRYSKATKEQIVKYSHINGVEETLSKYDVKKSTLYLWIKQQKETPIDNQVIKNLHSIQQELQN